ncbi:MAG TPA: DUF202 domain-containing protein [Rugosimonospora sp.]|nr:DUF202 domain-containing protein [Rugosimonospora sp.]
MRPPRGTGRNPAGGQPDQPDGAGPERTRLAWRRTALAQTVCTLLLFRLAADSGRWPGALVGALALLCWLASMAVGQLRIAEMGARRPASVGRALPVTALIMIVYAVLGLLLLALR